MRHIASILVVTAAISLVAMPLVRAQDQNSDSSSSPQGHVRQHQQVVPQNDQKDPNRAKADSAKPDQSAQVPQSPAVITPPTTGDKSVITPPAEGVAKTPVIKPPGTKGDKGEIHPN